MFRAAELARTDEVGARRASLKQCSSGLLYMPNTWLPLGLSLVLPLARLFRFQSRSAAADLATDLAAEFIESLALELASAINIGARRAVGPSCQCKIS